MVLKAMGFFSLQLALARPPLSNTSSPLIKCTRNPGLSQTPSKNHVLRATSQTIVFGTLHWLRLGSRIPQRALSQKPGKVLMPQRRRDVICVLRGGCDYFILSVLQCWEMFLNVFCHLADVCERSCHPAALEAPWRGGGGNLEMLYVFPSFSTQTPPQTPASASSAPVLVLGASCCLASTECIRAMWRLAN